MFDIGMSELVLLAIIGLIVIGPKQLPEVAAKLARLINDLKRMTGEFTGEFTKHHDAANKFINQTREDINRALIENTQSPSSPSSPEQPELPTMTQAQEPVRFHSQFPVSSGDTEQLSFDISEKKDPNKNG